MAARRAHNPQVGGWNPPRDPKCAAHGTPEERRKERQRPFRAFESLRLPSPLQSLEAAPMTGRMGDTVIADRLTAATIPYGTRTVLVIDGEIDLVLRIALSQIRLA